MSMKGAISMAISIRPIPLTIRFGADAARLAGDEFMDFL
jgi:hypothetical protein